MLYSDYQKAAILFQMLVSSHIMNKRYPGMKITINNFKCRKVEFTSENSFFVYKINKIPYHLPNMGYLVLFDIDNTFNDNFETYYKDNININNTVTQKNNITQNIQNMFSELEIDNGNINNYEDAIFVLAMKYKFFNNRIGSEVEEKNIDSELKEYPIISQPNLEKNKNNYKGTYACYTNKDNQSKWVLIKNIENNKANVIASYKNQYNNFDKYITKEIHISNLKSRLNRNRPFTPYQNTFEIDNFSFNNFLEYYEIN